MRRQLHTWFYAVVVTAYAATVLLYVRFHAVEAEPTNGTIPVRVNVGGETTTDTLGNTWEGDDIHQYYSTGNVVWACPRTISNTANDAVYCSYRWFNQIGTPYRYTFPQIHAGAYVVRLHFAELYVEAYHFSYF